MSFLFVPLIEDIPSSPDLFENCHINPEVYLRENPQNGFFIKYCKGVFDEKSANIECIFKYSHHIWMAGRTYLKYLPRYIW